MAVSIPDGPAGITADWLNAALGIDVAHLSVTPVGTGQTGSSYRLDAGANTYVVKLAAEDRAVRERVAFGYRAEVSFYDNVASTLKTPLPNCLASAISDDGHTFVLVFEDLAPAVAGDQLAGCSQAQAHAAVLALAGLHGPRWCDPAWRDFADTAMPIATAELAASLGELTQMAVDMFIERLGSRLRDLDRVTLEACPPLIAAWLLLYPERFSLLHGDFRLDNLMFAPGGGVSVLDWQTISVGLPARDLAYFLSTSLLPDQRREQEEELVATYHQALLGHGVRGYDLDTCRSDYRIGQLQTPLITTLGAAFSTTTDRGDEMMLVMIERSCAAIRELDTFALIEKELT
jgi:aminoglycoside phosphotransferase (APT) family kinase protein